MKTPKHKSIQFTLLTDTDKYFSSPSYPPVVSKPKPKKSAINLTHQHELPFQKETIPNPILSTEFNSIRTTKTFQKTSHHHKLKPITLTNNTITTSIPNNNKTVNNTKTYKSNNLYTRKCSDNISQVNYYNTINNSNSNSNSNNTLTTTTIRKTASFKQKRIRIECKETKQDYIKRFSMFIDSHTQAGQKSLNEVKTNQDSYISLTSVFGVQYFDVIGVFDGHGREGHLVSEYIKKYFTEYFSDKKRFFGKKDPSLILYPNPHFIHKHLTSNNNKSITNCFDNLEKEIEHSKIETQFSGATCDLIIRLVRKLIILNIGDSRSILVYKNKTKEYIVEQITTDHNPTVNEEKERIVSKGGEIYPYAEDVHNCSNPPLRVWVSGETYPGIAVSRSIGDGVAKKIGVVHTPEIRERMLKGNECFLITASDGVWEYLDNEKVKDIVMPFYLCGNYKGAAGKVVKEASDMWGQHGEKRDDITCVVYFFEDMFSI